MIKINYIRIIGFFLCLAYCFSCILVVDAAELESSTELTTGITEVVSLREEYVKHFDLGNGFYQAVVYDSAVHRLDASGQWQEINNNLYLNSARNSQSYTGSNNRINFAASLSMNQSILELNENNHSISMALTSDVIALEAATESVDAIVTNTPERRSAPAYYNSIEEAVQFNNISTVLYEDIIEGIDLEYILVGNDIKENIIVKESFESYSFTFALDLDGLYPQLTPGGSVLLLDTETNTEKYVIPSPFMYDANNVISFDVSYSLSQENGRWFLTVTADEDWCNALERRFPITIDPTIKVSSGVQDTYISSAYPTTNYGSNGQLWISRPPSGRLDSVTYLRFNLPEIPDGSTISNATINTYYCYPEHVTDGHITVGAYEMQYAWTESGLTWEMAENCGTTLGTSSTCLGIAYAEGNVGALPYSPKKLSIPITSLVQSWYNGTANYGLALKYMIGDKWSVIFKSSENTTGNYCPWITIVYSEPDYSFNDGIYRIENMNTDTYLTVQDSSIINYTPAILATKNAEIPSAYSQMWYIENVSNNYYTIRPVHMPEMILSLTGSNTVKLKHVATNLTNSELWYITHNDTGYEFINKSNGQALTSAESLVNTSAYEASNTLQNWQLHSINNLTPALLLYNTNTGTLISSSAHSVLPDFFYVTFSDSPLSLEQIGLKLVVVDTTATTHTITWVSSNTNIAIADVSTGSLTCRNIGLTQLSALLTISNTVYRIDIPIILTAPLSGQYFLYNHYYDSSISNRQLANIDDAVAFSNIAFSRQTNIAFGSNGTPFYTNIYTDGHMDIYNILCELQDSTISANEIAVLWTDYPTGTYCNHESTNTCQSCNYLAASLTGQRSIVLMDMLTYDGEPNPYLAYMAINLAHETAHSMGIGDRYTITPHNQEGYQCVMEYYHNADEAYIYYMNILYGDEQAFCETCTNDLMFAISNQ